MVGEIAKWGLTAAALVVFIGIAGIVEHYRDCRLDAFEAYTLLLALVSTYVLGFLLWFAYYGRWG